MSLEAYKLNGFKFERIILGTVPFRIGGVKVYDKHTDRNEIIMDLDIFYAGDCDVTFHLAGMKGGIRDFQVRNRKGVFYCLDILIYEKFYCNFESL